MPRWGKPKRSCMVLLARAEMDCAGAAVEFHGCPARNGSSLAAALALAGVLALASVLVGLAPALALTGVLALAGVLTLRVVQRLRAAGADVGLKSGALAVIGLGARDDTGDGCSDENRGHVDVLSFSVGWSRDG